jgi:uncharacterized protein (TIGR00251 family)
VTFARSIAGGVEIAVLVQPRASRTRVVGLHDGLLKIQLAAPPVDGAANEALLEFLADALEVPRRALALVGGETSRRKRVSVSGIDLQRATELGER